MSTASSRPPHRAPHHMRLRLTFALLMSGLMSVLMSAWIIWFNTGATPGFLARWGHTFLAAWPAAFATVLLMAPVMQRVSARLVHGRPKQLHAEPAGEMQGAASAA